VTILELRSLGVTYRLPDRTVPALRDLSLTLQAGETLGLAGESGSGKSTLALAVLRLLPPGTAVCGQVLLAGEDVQAMPWGRLRAVRWTRAAIVFQGAMHSLNPVRRIGAQIAEPILLHHRGATPAQARRSVVDLLDQVGLPARLASSYSHELSGGQRQRVMIAIALACRPQLVIADEPTTALDGIAQTQVLRLLTDLTTADAAALLLISHDLRLLASTCGRLAVLRAGRIVDTGPAATLITAPRHPYTAALVAASGTVGEPVAPALVRPPTAYPSLVDASRPARPVLSARDVVVRLPGRRGGRVVHALDGVSLDLGPAEIVALTGQTGSGKTTLAHTLVGLRRPTSGEVRYEERPLRYERAESARYRRSVQLVPQDPTGGLNPRHTVARAVGEGLRIHALHADDRPARVAAALARVGLNPPERFLPRYPGQLSEGQRQRVILAAALVLEPQVLVADEPVASLDAVTRGGILTLLRQLRDSIGLSILLITHDLAAAWRLADRLCVLYLGRIIESGPVKRVLTAPAHPYTQALLAATTSPLSTVLAPDSEPTDSTEVPPGCRFHPRCPALASGAAERAGVAEHCRHEPPLPRLRSTAGETASLVECHLPDAASTRDPATGAGTVDAPATRPN
jgi:peptide/nickel transport system ATP-binding protein